MDELELACSAVVAVAEKRPPEDATYEELKEYGFRKSFDVQLAVAHMAKVLRARLAKKVSLNHQGTNGNAVTVALFSDAVNK